jgi:hypothetical protein
MDDPADPTGIDMDQILRRLGVDLDEPSELAKQYEREYQQRLEKEMEESDDHTTILLRRILSEIRILNRILIASLTHTKVDREQ